MSIFRRRRTVEQIMEDLRLISCECSGLGLEEETEGQVEQASAAKEEPMTVKVCPRCREETAHFNGVCACCTPATTTTTQTAPREFCCECNISFGLAEKRFAIDQKGVAHEDCYVKHVALVARSKVVVHRRYAIH